MGFINQRSHNVWGAPPCSENPWKKSEASEASGAPVPLRNPSAFGAPDRSDTAAAPRPYLDPAGPSNPWRFLGISRRKNYLKKPIATQPGQKKQLAIEHPRIFKFGKPSSSMGHFPVSKLLVYQRVSLAKFI